MASKIKKVLQGEAARVTWIDYSAYAATIFNLNTDSWANSATITSAMSQSYSLIRPDVVTLSLTNIFFPDILRPVGSLDAMSTSLEDGDKIKMLVDTIEGLSYSLGGEADLVLSLPTPSAAMELSGLRKELCDDFSSLDLLGTSYCDLFRQVSELGVEGIVLRHTRDNGVISEDERDAMEPVLSLSKYYGWTLAVSFERSPCPSEGQDFGDIALFPNVGPEILESSTVGFVFGGGLTAPFWYGEQPPPRVGICFGNIPPDAEPEVVLERCELL